MFLLCIVISILTCYYIKKFFKSITTAKSNIMLSSYFNSGDSLSQCRKNIFAFLSITIVVLSIYSNNYNASWHFDDEPNILLGDTVHMTELSWNKVKNSLYKGEKIYRPVSRFSLAVNYFFGRENVLGYHIVNNTIHIITAIFLFLFLHNTLKTPTLEQKYNKNTYEIALLASVIWAANPIHTQAVTYIIQRMASMAGMFYIMSFYFYLKMRISNTRHHRIFFFITFILCSFLAFGTKENTIVLPVGLILYEVYIIKGITLQEWYASNKKLCILSFAAISVLALVYIYSLVGTNFPGMFGKYADRPFTLLQRILTESRIIFFYFKLLLYPDPYIFSINHDITLSTSLFNPISTFFSVSAIIFMMILAFIIANRRPLIAFCILFFFLNHIVESTVIPLELVYEHRNYIPSMLFFVPFSILIISLLSKERIKKYIQLLIFILVTFFIISQGHSTYARNIIWGNEKNLWLDSVDKYPDLWRAHHNLGRAYEKEGRYDNAIHEYMKAISTDRTKLNRSEELYTFNNLGVLSSRLKKYDSALEFFKKAEEIDSSFAPLYMNRGNLYILQGKLGKAAQEYLHAIELDKNLASVFSNLGYIQLISGDIDSAIYNIEWAHYKGFKNSVTYRHLGQANRLKEYFGKASIMFNKSLELNPDDHLTLLNLVELYDKTGLIDKREKTMVRFFKSFRGDNQALTDFFTQFVNYDSGNRDVFPRKNHIISLLSEKFRERIEDLRLATDRIDRK